MAARNIKPDVYWVGAIDWDRRLFDELIPLPDGTSYNSYLIRGRDRTALLDTVDPTRTAELLGNLAETGTGRIDYVVCHHAEQDHSGSLPMILELQPQAKVVTNAKCREILETHLPIPAEKFVTVADRETLDLGGKTLEFIIAPWVHWPDTMFSYLKEDRILFTCDFLGSHLATSDLYVREAPLAYHAAKRYFAEIMMPFRANIRGHLEKIKDLPIDVIAPSHGPLYDHPSFIIEAYRDWVSDLVRNEVVLAYVSMHGSVRKMADHLTEALIKKGIKVRSFNLTRTDIGELAMALVDAATIVIGSPTVLAGAHPAAVYAAFLANALRPKTKFVSLFGSYGWGGKMPEAIKGLIGNLGAKLLEPVVIRGYPRSQDLAALDRLAEDIRQAHLSVNARE
jgi:flavorubredoxin